MTQRIRILFAATAGGLIGAWLTTALAQSPALDPPQVAPHIYEVLLDNERVRVMKVTERNGETQPLHRLGDRVVAYISNCAWISENDDGETRMDGYKFGEVVWRDAETKGGTSNVIDACLSLAIELKD